MAKTDNPVTRAKLEQALNQRWQQLAALNNLNDLMEQAEMGIEATISMLGTTYSQLCISVSTNQTVDYAQVAGEVREQVHQLQDQLSAFRDLKTLP